MRRDVHISFSFGSKHGLDAFLLSVSSSFHSRYVLNRVHLGFEFMVELKIFEGFDFSTLLVLLSSEFLVGVSFKMF